MGRARWASWARFCAASPSTHATNCLIFGTSAECSEYATKYAPSLGCA
jgi:hypothetical protein